MQNAEPLSTGLSLLGGLFRALTFSLVLGRRFLRLRRLAAVRHGEILAKKSGEQSACSKHPGATVAPKVVCGTRAQTLSQQDRRSFKKRACKGARSPKIERSAETKAAPDTPAKGPTEQHLADAPVRGARSKHSFCGSRAGGAQVAVCLEAVLNARASFQILVAGGCPPVCVFSPVECFRKKRIRSNARILRRVER